MRLQRLWRRYVQLPCLVLLYASKKCRGGLFCLRSMPDWFVYFLASLPDDGTGSDVQCMCDEAYEERIVRRRIQPTGTI